MGKFVYLTDIHLKLTNPRKRKSDFFEDTMKMMVWVGEYAREIGADAIIGGGDLGDHYDWKISMLRKVKEVIDNYPCKFYSIVGNHDVPGKNMELLEDSGIGILPTLCPNFEILKPYQIIDKFQFYPFHSDIEDTKDLINGNSKITLDENYLRVAVVHAPVGRDDTPYCKGHKTLEIDNFDVALFGDIHPGFEPWELESGCVVANPGSIAILGINDIDHIPKIAVVEDTGKIAYVTVPTKTGKEIFDIVDNTKVGQSFIDTINSRIVRDIDPKKYVLEVGKDLGISEESINLLLGELDGSK